jgi:hypothetical protein
LSRLTQNILMALFLVAGAIYGLFFIEQEPKPPPAPSATQEKISASPSVPTPSVPAAATFWPAQPAKLEAVGPADQPALDQLYLEAGKAIAASPSAFEAHFREEILQAKQPPLRYAFFSVNSALRFHPEPARVLLPLLAKKPERVRKEDVHHGSGPGVQWSLLRNHALFEMAKTEKFNGHQPTIELAEKIARQDADLTLVRGAMLLLLKIDPAYSRAQLARLVEKRPARERFAFEDLLN